MRWVQQWGRVVLDPPLGRERARERSVMGRTFSRAPSCSVFVGSPRHMMFFFSLVMMSIAMSTLRASYTRLLDRTGTGRRARSVGREGLTRAPLR